MQLCCNHKQFLKSPCQHFDLNEGRGWLQFDVLLSCPTHDQDVMGSGSRPLLRPAIAGSDSSLLNGKNVNFLILNFYDL